MRVPKIDEPIWGEKSVEEMITIARLLDGADDIKNFCNDHILAMKSDDLKQISSKASLMQRAAKIITGIDDLDEIDKLFDKE